MNESEKAFAVYVGGNRFLVSCSKDTPAELVEKVRDPNPERTGLIKTDCAFLVNRDPVKQPRDPQWLAGHICP